MRRLVLLLLALATLLPSLAMAYDVLVLQSRHDAAYEEVLNGFRAGNSASQRIVVLSDFTEVDVVRIVREEHPAIILAIGDRAVKQARAVRSIPVLSVMALGNDVSSAPNAIAMFAPPGRYCQLFNNLKVRRAGIIYDPAKTGWYLKHARAAAEKAGIELVVRSVLSPKDALAQLATLAGKVDVLWMFPDTTAVTRETTEAWFRFSMDHSIPVVSFAASYLNLGAAAVVEIDLTELGRQAGSMVASLLEQGTTSATPPVFPHGTVFKTNPAVLKKLGISKLAPD